MGVGKCCRGAAATPGTQFQRVFKDRRMLLSGGDAEFMCDKAAKVV